MFIIELLSSSSVAARLRLASLAAGPAIAILALPALASEPQKPVADKEVTAVDVVATPAGDLNIRKDEIPALLLAAEQQPYGLGGLSNCRRIAAAVSELDAMLGDDIDLPQGDKKRTSAGRVAQSVVGSFIPFRGIVRELSGANEHDRKLQTAILAGVARRSFLKGTGQARGCGYPARGATAQAIAQRRTVVTNDRPTEAEKASTSPAP